MKDEGEQVLCSPRPGLQEAVVLRATRGVRRDVLDELTVVERVACVVTPSNLPGDKIGTRLCMADHHVDHHCAVKRPGCQDESKTPIEELTLVCPRARVHVHA